MTFSKYLNFINGISNWISIIYKWRYFCKWWWIFDYQDKLIFVERSQKHYYLCLVFQSRFLSKHTAIMSSINWSPSRPFDKETDSTISHIIQIIWTATYYRPTYFWNSVPNCIKQRFHNSMTKFTSFNVWKVFRQIEGI